MKAIVVTEQGAGTAGMKLVERPDPRGCDQRRRRSGSCIGIRQHGAGLALDLGRSPRPRPSTGYPRARAGRSGDRPRLWHDGALGRTVGVRPHGLVTLAEYVAVEARNLAPLPGDVDFTVGASLPISGLTAWQGLTVHGRLSARRRVMAHGAAGRARPRPRASGGASRAGPQPDIN
jgi:hypothetical protein